MDWSVYLPNIITAAVSLISVIATSVVTIIINHNNNKREIARLKHEHHLKLLSSNNQIKRDVCTDTYSKMINAEEEIAELSIEANQIINGMKKRRAKYPSYFDKKYDSLSEIYSELSRYISTVELFSSRMCIWHYVVFLQIVHSIKTCEYGRFTPIAFLTSEIFHELWFALENCKNNYLEQCKSELFGSEDEGREIISITSTNGYVSGYMIKRNSGEITLLAGSRIQKKLEKEYWKSDSYYVMSNNKKYDDIKSAIAYLINGNTQYEYKTISFEENIRNV